MNESLIAICQLFLVPLTILFAAVGVANARFVKLLVCLLGVGLAGLWLYRIYLWTGLSVIDRRTAYGPRGSLRAMLGADAAASDQEQLRRRIRSLGSGKSESGQPEREGQRADRGMRQDHHGSMDR